MSARSISPAVLAAAVSAALAAAVLLSCVACRGYPDPRELGPAEMQTKSLGSWIVVQLKDRTRLQGELIAIDTKALYVLLHHGEQRAFRAVPLRALEEASLYRYGSSASSLGFWTLGGVLSTASHGVLLILSAPVWALIGGSLTISESNHIMRYYPEHSVREISKWARFPQGMPPGLSEQALLTPVPLPPPPPPSDPPMVEPARSAPAITAPPPEKTAPAAPPPAAPPFRPVPSPSPTPPPSVPR